MFVRMSGGRLIVPKPLAQQEPDTRITGAERAVAMEIATIVRERRLESDVDTITSDMLVLDVPAQRLRNPEGRDDNHHLHRVLSRLAKVQWHDQEPNGRRYVVQLIGQAEIEGDTVRLWLPPRAVRFLVTPAQFAVLDRAATYQLPPNARTLYALLKDRFAQPEKLTRHEAEYTLDELKGHLGLGDRYKYFGDFRKRVLDPSVKAINETGALAVTWEPVKWGKRITAVRFKLRLKEPEEGDKAEREAGRHRDARGKEPPQPPADAEPLAPGNKPDDGGAQLDIDAQALAKAWWESLPMDRRARLTRSYDPQRELARDDLIVRVWQDEGQPKPEGR